ncbi:MAG: chemotaxis protein CheX [Fimbriimonadaceae bacterium]|nr:chemotaxis protein CheX [Fimbriimonadaceae bacterium]
MKVEYINPFAEACMNVMQQVIGLTPERGNLTARPQMFTTQQVNVMCGVTGAVEGLVIYGLSSHTADKIAGLMIGQPVQTFDQLAASAIAELGNMISGNSVAGLAAKGFVCDITPPTIIRGANVKISTLNIPAICIPLQLANVGTFEINISLQERRVSSAA